MTKMEKGLLRNGKMRKQLSALCYFTREMFTGTKLSLKAKKRSVQNQIATNAQDKMCEV